MASSSGNNNNNGNSNNNNGNNGNNNNNNNNNNGNKNNHHQNNQKWVPRRDSRPLNPVNPLFVLTPSEKLAIMEAMDHMNVTRQYQEMGSCTVCKKISVRKCSGCNSFYCSNECQTFDWPNHRAHCQRQRDSASDRGSFASGRRLRSAAGRQFGDGSLFMTERSSPFRSLANQLSKKSGMPGTDSRCNFKIASRQYHQSRESRGSEPGTSNEGRGRGSNTTGRRKFSPQKKNSVCKSIPGTCGAGSSSGNVHNHAHARSKGSNKSASPAPVKSEGVADSSSSLEKKHRSPMKLGKTEVVPTYRETAERYWVMTACDLKRYQDIHDILSNNCRKYPTVTPQVGLICACKFDDDWFRGEITAVDPEVIIHYIDYGNYGTSDTNVFKKLPEHLITEPGLVFVVEFDDNTPMEFKTKDMVSTKILVQETSRTPDGAVRVTVFCEVPDRPVDPPTPTPVRKQRPEPTAPKEPELDEAASGPLLPRMVMDYLTNGDTGTLYLVPGEEKLRFASILPKNNPEAKRNLDRLLHMPGGYSRTISAELGDWVLVIDGEGNDHRAKVVLKYGPTYYVRLVDCGHNICVDRVYPLGDEFKNLPWHGVRITIEHIVSFEQLRTVDKGYYTITGEPKEGRWPTNIRNAQGHLLARAFMERPSEPLTWQPDIPVLKSGCTVEMVSLYSTNAIYIRPVDVLTEQKFLDLNMEIGQFAAEAQRFAHPPLPGELCSARSRIDNCYYRAIVHSFEDVGIAVVFVDFGFQQITPIRDIKPLPEHLKRVPFFALKVLLKNVSGKTWNNMIIDYIEKLMAENTELTLTYDGAFSDGVVLREKVSGLVVNDFVDGLIDKPTPPSEEEEPTEEIFWESDLTYSMLVPRTICTLAILYVNDEEFENDGTFWGSSMNDANFHFVNLEMNDKMIEYCLTASPYKPAYRELCIGEFEGSWYRAVCLECTDDTYKVFFVDFGNVSELKPESIRKILKEFVPQPALALKCTLQGHERMNGNRDPLMKVCTVLKDKVNSFITGVTITAFEDGRYVLYIPELDSMMSS